MRSRIVCGLSNNWYRNYGGIFDFARMTAELAHLEEQTSQPDFWSQAQKAAKISRKKSTIERDLQQWHAIDEKMNDLGALLELAEESRDAGLAKELTGELDRFEPKLATLRLELLLSGELDPNNAIVAIHPGAGGTESQDWAQMLLRMYVRWAESKKFKIETLDLLPGEEAGVKSVTLSVTGAYAYGYLKAEAGVHRLVIFHPSMPTNGGIPPLPQSSSILRWMRISTS